MISRIDTAKNGRVILTSGRSLMALVIAQSLGKKGVEIYGGDSLDQTVLSYSKYTEDNFLYTDPHKDEEQFLEDLLAKVKALKPEDDRPYVLIPVLHETSLLAKNREKFEPQIKLAAPDYEAINKLHPKNNFAQTIKDLDIFAPQTWLPSSEEELREIAKTLPYPVLIKPYNQSSGRGIHKVKDAEDLQIRWQENKDNYNQKSLIQEMAEGQDYCLSALYDHGTRKASMAYRNLHRFPLDSGPGVMRETVPSARFEAIPDKLMGALEWNGVAEFDFLWDEKEGSTPRLIEVNPRFWSGLFHSVESGIDFPWLLYQLCVNGEVDAPEEKAQIGTKTKLPMIWWASFLSDLGGSDEQRQTIVDRGRKAIDEWKETRQARSELFNSDDPTAAFGVLYILDSLVRYGELPKELKL